MPHARRTKWRTKKKILIFFILVILIFLYTDSFKTVKRDLFKIIFKFILSSYYINKYGRNSDFKYPIKTPVTSYSVFDTQNTININSNCPVCKPNLQLTRQQFKDISKYNFYCNTYSMITRNSSQKVIGLSLYGSDQKYYNGAKEYIKLARKYYPDWLIRIYVDKSSIPNIICEIECSEYGRNVDFCDVSQIPYFKTNSDDEPDMYYVDLSYMHAMSWRFLPIGDDYVNVFMSRDSDAWVIQREIDSVNVWLQSNELFHAMRDHPEHNVPILGGLWGFKNKNDRQLSKKILNIITNKNVAEFYNPNYINKKGEDQFLLEDYIWPMVKWNATVHDSYFCTVFGGKPFPTMRPDRSCYLSCTECCEEQFSKKHSVYKECPFECRPESHKNWLYC